MKLKKIMCCLMGSVIICQGISALAYGDISVEDLREKQLEFASKYEYKDGDIEKSFKLYPEILYTSGIEKSDNGTEYECPAIYIDDHAKMVNNYSLEKGKTKLIVNGEKSQYWEMCVAYNSRLLVPADVFSEVGLSVNTDAGSYVTTISKEDTVLEILPNLIGMRKNQTDGFYVPMEVCARIIDGVLYVPVRAVSDEFNLSVTWEAETNTVMLNNM